MDLQTSHLAAALLSGTNSYNNAVPESNGTTVVEENKTDHKVEEPKSNQTEEDKEEIGSGDEFSDEVCKPLQNY